MALKHKIIIQFKNDECRTSYLHEVMQLYGSNLTFQNLDSVFIGTILTFVSHDDKTLELERLGNIFENDDCIQGFEEDQEMHSL